MFAFLTRLCLVAGALLACLIQAAPAHAQAGTVGTPLKICVAKDAPGTSVRAAFTGAMRFDCAVKQSTLGSGDFWALSSVFPKGAGRYRPLGIRTASLWQESATLYVLYADGKIASLSLTKIDASRHLQLGAIIEQRPPIRGVPVVRLLWHIKGSANLRGVLLGATIATPAESARSNLIMAAFYAGFGGLCLALLVHNIALWWALRRRFQLAYITMVATLAVYALSSSGAIAWLFPGIANTDRMRINYALLGVSASAAVLFARWFFEERVFSRRLIRMAYAAAAAMTGAGLLYAAAAPWHMVWLDRIFAFAFLGVLLVIVPVLYRAWREKSRVVWLFSLAWGVPIALASVRLLNNLYAMPWSFWLDNSTIASMTIESLISSLAIAYRVRLLSAERDDARAQEIAARLLADTDPLTGLLNRRSFLGHAIGREGEFQLILTDIDHFKSINDTIGHDGGDEVLRVVSRIMRQSAATESLVVRLGGEEFGILSPAAKALDPEALLERLRTQRMPFDISVTASIGVCTGPMASEADWKTIYHATDRALLDAKAAGRDRVRRSFRAAA